MAKQAHHMRISSLLFILVVCCTSAKATIFEEFLFNDPLGTLIEEAANNVTSNMFDSDSDNAMVTTNGMGQLNASLKNNTLFGTNYVDNDPLSTGTIYGVIEMTWDFQSTLDPAENEQVRISLINSDPRSTEITAELRVERTDDDQIVVNGQAGGTGSSDLANVLLNGGSLSQSQKFIGVVAANLDNSTYEILYSTDNGNNFLSAGTGTSASGRIVESMRLTLNNDLLNDNVLIDRIYLTDENPVATIDQLTLEVNTTTGATRIVNSTGGSTFDIDHYSITSDSMSLNDTGWSSLDDQNFDAIGPGIGESWDEAAGSDSDTLAELFLLGSSDFAPGEFVSLGSAFSVGGMEDLEFRYHDAANGNVFDGEVVYVTGGLIGDYDGSGLVSAGDLDLVLANWGVDSGVTGVPSGWVNDFPIGLISAEELDRVLNNWGNSVTSAVPEPGCLGIMLVGLVFWGLRRR